MAHDPRNRPRSHPGGARAGGPPRTGSGGGRGGSDEDENEIAEILKGSNKIMLWSDGEQKTLRPELLDAEAQNRARALREVSSTQLRRFYGPAVAFKQRLQMDQSITDREVEAQVAYLKASSAYAGARKQPTALVEFFVAAANTVKTRDDYLAFTRHFEAVMAFHKVFEAPRKER
jgi:CRISPR-associated protein Csm2